MQLVHDAIAAGIFNDLGSGSNVDLCVITKDNVELLRPFNVATKKGVKWVFCSVFSLFRISIHFLPSKTHSLLQCNRNFLNPKGKEITSMPRVPLLFCRRP